MFSLRAIAAALVAVLFTNSASATGPGTLSSPAANTSIAPGQAFNFNYITRADYGVSSYNFTVWLSTIPPTSFGQSENFMSGHYFGRFSLPNYPANPYPTNPPPAQLVMPNFSLAPGGFGAGTSASNAQVYLVVLEEFADGTGVLGKKFSLHYNPIIYNGTQTS